MACLILQHFIHPTTFFLWLPVNWLTQSLTSYWWPIRSDVQLWQQCHRNKKKFAELSVIISLNIQYSSSILRHHVILFIGTLMCLIKGRKLIVMWESLLSHGLTTSKVNVSHVGPMGSNGWETRGKGEETWRKDVASHPGFILIPAVSLLPGPRWSSTTGERRWGHSRGREGRESVEGENEQALILFPGDLWS